MSYSLKLGRILLIVSWLGCMLLISCKDEKDEPRIISVGDFYQGGIVFYLDGTSGGLIVAMEDQSSSANWCSNTDEISGADGEAIGTGKQNTADILAGCLVSGSAADLSDGYSISGFSDWFLPSVEEFEELYDNLTLVNAALTQNGGTALSEDTYWTSTELDVGNKTSAVTYSIEFGTRGSLTKFGTARVRAVREF